MEHCQGLPSSERLLSAWGDFLSQEGQGQAWRLLEVGLIQQEVRRWIKIALLRNRGGREGFGLPCSDVREKLPPSWSSLWSLFAVFLASLGYVESLGG